MPCGVRCGTARRRPSGRPSRATARLLLKNIENLDTERDEQKRLPAVTEPHQP